MLNFAVQKWTLRGNVADKIGMLAFHYCVYLDYEPVRDTNLACVFAEGRGSKNSQG